MTGPEKRTAELARLSPKFSENRLLAMVLSGIVALAMVGFAVVCNGLQFLIAFLSTPGLALVAAVFAFGLAAPYLAVILWLDHNEPEPTWLVIATLAWGGVAATGVSVFGNTLLGAVFVAVTGDPELAAQLTASISAPLVEESTKGFALILLYLFFRRHFDSVLDGVIYGALLGLGFAVIENWMYYINSGALLDMAFVVLIRGVVTSAGTHMCFTAMTGAAVGGFRVLRQGLLRWFLPPLGLGMAMGIHFVWNTFTSQIMGLFDNDLAQIFFGLPLAVVLLQLPFLALVAIVALVASIHETRTILLYLDGEAALREGELNALVPARRRLFFLATVLLQQGPKAWWHQRRRFAALVQLAMEKWHMDQEAALGSTDATTHAVQVRTLRAALKAMP